MRHEGEVGYPLANLTEMQVIKSKYLSVFDADGCLRTDYDAGAAGSMLAALTGLKNLTDDQIRYPDEGRYLLRSYQALPATHHSLLLLRARGRRRGGRKLASGQRAGHCAHPHPP